MPTVWSLGMMSLLTRAIGIPTHTYATYASLAARTTASDALLEEAEADGFLTGGMLLLQAALRSSQRHEQGKAGKSRDEASHAGLGDQSPVAARNIPILWTLFTAGTEFRPPVLIHRFIVVKPT